MDKGFYMLLTLAIISGLHFVKSETALRDNPNLFNNEHTDAMQHHKDQTAQPIKDDERITSRMNVLWRLKGNFGSEINKPTGVRLNRRGAVEAFTKLKTIVGFYKTPQKMTPTKFKNLETYARNNPDKWDEMTNYLEYAYGVALVVFMLGGAVYLGWRFY